MGSSKLKSGDIFVVPLEDSELFCVGELISIEKEVMNSVLCCFYDKTVDSDAPKTEEELILGEPISVQFVTPDLLKNGTWKVICQSVAKSAQDYIDINERREKGFIGTKVRGSAVIRKFLSAYHGLIPWNCYYRDDYLDEFVLTGQRPSTSFMQ